MAVKPIPEGSHAITPHLVVRNAARAIEFYKKAFGAEQVRIMSGPNGSIVHAELKVGDSRFYLADEFPEMNCVGPETVGNCTTSLHLFVVDVDATFKRAVDAGAKTEMPVQDMFWGDRYGKLKDPFGHVWSVATHKEDLTDQEIEKRQAEFFKQMAGARK